ncbi:hypothetical protein K438DRAFT_1784526 [Mycena galopus ATCC 62051]|nr:hypothetical protein K438DRAFT_1784526 [Mycena galopus ATCC 62051]
MSPHRKSCLCLENRNPSELGEKAGILLPLIMEFEFEMAILNGAKLSVLKFQDEAVRKPENDSYAPGVNLGSDRPQPIDSSDLRNYLQHNPPDIVANPDTTHFAPHTSPSSPVLTPPSTGAKSERGPRKGRQGSKGDEWVRCTKRKTEEELVARRDEEHGAQSGPRIKAEAEEEDEGGRTLAEQNQRIAGEMCDLLPRWRIERRAATWPSMGEVVQRGRSPRGGGSTMDGEQSSACVGSKISVSAKRATKVSYRLIHLYESPAELSPSRCVGPQRWIQDAADSAPHARVLDAARVGGASAYSRGGLPCTPAYHVSTPGASCIDTTGRIEDGPWLLGAREIQGWEDETHRLGVPTKAIADHSEDTLRMNSRL